MIFNEPDSSLKKKIVIYYSQSLAEGFTEHSWQEEQFLGRSAKNKTKILNGTNTNKVVVSERTFTGNLKPLKISSLFLQQTLQCMVK